jgi:hypothetical protein
MARIPLHERLDLTLVSLGFFNRTIPRLQAMMEVLEDELFVEHVISGGSHKDYKQAVLRHPKRLSLQAAIDEVGSIRKLALRMRKSLSRAEIPNSYVDLDFSQNTVDWILKYNENHDEIWYRFAGKKVSKDVEETYSEGENLS